MSIVKDSTILKSDLVSLYNQLYNIQVKFGLTQTSKPDNSNSVIYVSDLATLKTNAEGIASSKYISSYISLINNWNFVKDNFVVAADWTTVQNNLDTIYNICAHDSYDSSYKGSHKSSHYSSDDSTYKSLHYSTNKSSHDSSHNSSKKSGNYSPNACSGYQSGNYTNKGSDATDSVWACSGNHSNYCQYCSGG